VDPHDFELPIDLPDLYEDEATAFIAVAAILLLISFAIIGGMMFYLVHSY
jgi:hypothetical protein